MEARNARIEAKLKTGVSPNKGVKTLARTSVSMASESMRTQVSGLPSYFVTMLTDFQHMMRKLPAHPGFSNAAVQCVGKGVSRSFLAELCDNERLMGTLSPTGITLVELAKRDLNMNEDMALEAASKTLWIQTNNLPSPAKLCSLLVDPSCSKELDWMWMEMSSMSSGNTMLLRPLLSAIRTQGCKAFIFFWCCGGQLLERSASEWSEWCASVWPDWGVCRREVQNTHCGGPIRCNTSLLITAPLS